MSDRGSSQQIRDLLDRRDSEFRGVTWQPRRLLGINGISLVMEVVADLVTDVLEVNLSGLPSSGKLTRAQYEIEVAYDKIVRNRLFDQGEFFKRIGEVFTKSGLILEELDRLDRAGYFDPAEQPET